MAGAIAKLLTVGSRWIDSPNGLAFVVKVKFACSAFPMTSSISSVSECTYICSSYVCDVYVCMYVCLCVCVRARACVCVCVQER